MLIDAVLRRLRRRAARLRHGPATALLVPLPGLPLTRPPAGAPPHHVTVVYPFIGLRRVDERLRRDLQETFGELPAFDVRLTAVRRFPGVLYLAPEPAEPFVRLTEAAVRRWPDHPPYGGRFEQVVPHLTLAEGPAPAGLIEQVTALLPLTARAEQVSLLAPAPGGGWRTLLSVPLAGSP